MNELLNPTPVHEQVMQHSVQSLYDDFSLKNGKLKELQRDFKEMCEDDEAYNGVQMDLKMMREKRNDIVDGIKGKNPKAAEQIESLKLEVKASKQMLDMRVIEELRSGRKVEVEDQMKRKELYPNVSVTFSTNKQLSLFDYEA